MSDLVLFGAGSAGRYVLAHLRGQGIDPICFADNNADLWGTSIYGIPVMSPYSVNAPGATWVAAAISRPAAVEIRAQMKSMGVTTKPLWECLPVCHGLPPAAARHTIESDTGTPTFHGDYESVDEWLDQLQFRNFPNYDRQRNPSPISEIYFPPFIAHRDDEVYLDLGASRGETVKPFIERWEKWKAIVAFEPDQENYTALCKCGSPEGKITYLRMAVADFDGYTSFTENGDYSSHLGDGPVKVRVTTLDKMLMDVVPTYIKADIEGSELQAIWGARSTLKKHMPVLAICAYHTSDHLWEIPLLIHAIQPDYRMFLRRYAEGAFELVWYAVPLERVP